MAVAAAPITNAEGASGLYSDGSYTTGLFKLTFSGSYATGGDAIDFLPLFGGLVSAILTVDISGGAGNQFEYDLPNKKIKAFPSANTELGAGAYNAAITGDTNIVATVMAK